jgi:hypothetical protein
MFQMHTYGRAAEKYSARPGVSSIGDFSHPAARRLAREACMIVGLLLLWAMLSALLLSTLEKVGDPGSCVFLGRAGTRCARTPGGGGKDPSASDRDCRLLGRAGWDCGPKTPSN